MEHDIVGRWFVDDAVEINFENEVEVFRYDKGSVSDTYIEFGSNGAGFIYDGEDGTDSFTYTISKTSLVLKYAEGDNTSYQIRKLDLSALSIYEEFIETYDGIVHKELIEINLVR